MIPIHIIYAKLYIIYWTLFKDDMWIAYHSNTLPTQIANEILQKLESHYKNLTYYLFL